MPSEGASDALIVVDIMDPSDLTGHTYELTFDTLASLADVVFTLRDSTTGETLFLEQPLPDTSSLDELPVTDGFRLILRNTSPGFASLAWIEVQGDTCTFDWFVDDRGRGEAVRVGYLDFEIVIDTTAETEASVLRPNSVYGDLPFLEVDTVFTVPLRGYAIQNSESVESDRIVCVEPYYMYPDTFTVSPPGWDLVPGGLAWPRRESAQNLYPDQVGLYLYHRDTLSGEVTDSSYVFVRTLNGDSTETPPSHGDRFTISVHKPLMPGVVYRFTCVGDQYADSPPLDSIRVVPNPYIVQAAWEISSTEKMLMFTHLPLKCDIHIYTLAGEHVATVVHDSDLGYEFWDLKSKHGLDVAYGLYIYVVETEWGETKVGKFSVIR
jgi:hypothetical protein